MVTKLCIFTFIKHKVRQKEVVTPYRMKMLLLMTNLLALNPQSMNLMNLGQVGQLNSVNISILKGIKSKKNC